MLLCLFHRIWLKILTIIMLVAVSATGRRTKRLTCIGMLCTPTQSVRKTSHFQLLSNRKLRKSSTVLGRSTTVMQLFRFFQFFSFGCSFILSLQAVHGREINTWNDRAHSETNDEIAAQLFKKFVNTHERIYLNDSEEYNRRLAIFKVVTFLYM